MRVLPLFIVVLFLECSNNKKPLHLIDNFYSYQSQFEVRQLISNVKFRGNIEGLSTGRADSKHLSEVGKWGFLFFEDQLVAIGFHPVDTMLYLNKLEEIFGIIPGDKPIVYQGVQIQKGFDYEMGGIGGLFVSWCDPDLKKRYEAKVW